ncbi:putative ABC transport system permease protein [Nocardia tenerifensis]|uniref:Putative ABC transport system permease protein n=1 Tax=Nocardia tenerifensis TaxID=228006 RepID=A0A318KPX5_9NOCA|nr:FtsX-like permease family protein [Nocardia tenerifensis]PXX71710.1 putative ABC transport system permease protein [Nocardia tenerifensis]
MSLGSVLSRLRVLNMRQIVVFRGRVAAVVAVLAASSALLVAVLGTYGSLAGSVSRLTESLAGAADLQVSGLSDTGFGEEIVSAVGAAPGVATAVPMLQIQLPAGAQRITVLGADARISALHSRLQAAVGDQVQLGSALLRTPNGVVVGDRMGLSEGDPYPIGATTVRVAAVVGGAAAEQINGGYFVIAPLPLAQRIADRPGRVDLIYVVKRQDADSRAVTQAVTDAVAGRAVVSGLGLRTAQTGDAVALTRSITLLVSAVSLVVAAFLVFNVASMTVAERRRSIAVLRALGASRAMMVRDLLSESAVLGLVAGLLGAPVGILLGRFVIGRLPPFLIQAVSARIEFILPWYAVPVAVLACVGAAVAASAVAVRQVFTVTPVEALQSAETIAAEQIPIRFAAVAAIAGGFAMVVAFVAARIVHSPLVFAAAGLFVVGLLGVSVAVMTPIAELSARVAGRLGPAGPVAAAAMRRAPRRTWAMMLTVATAVALGVASSGATANMITSAEASFAGLRDVDVVVSTSPSDVLPAGASLPEGVADAVSRVPGVAAVVPEQWAFLSVHGVRVSVEGLADGAAGVTAHLMSDELRRRVIRGEGIVISRQLAERFGYGVGDSVPIATPGGARETTLLGVVSVLSPVGGTIAMSLRQLQEWFARPGATQLAVRAAPDRDAAELATRVRAAVPDSVYVFTGEAGYVGAVGNIAQVGAMTVALQWVIALLAAVALTNTLMLSVLARRREIGILRALGSSRRMMSRAVIAEACGVGLVGGAIGLLCGTALHYLATVSMSTTTAVDITFRVGGLALVYGGVAIVLCTLGALPPATRAARMNVVEAIAAD